MKVLLAFGLLFGVTVNFASQATQAKPFQEKPTVEQRTSTLELSLVAQKLTYKRNDQFKLQVLLRNSSEKDLYVFGTLDWGFSGSLMFYVRDASGKEVEPLVVPDSPPNAPPDDKSAFVKLRPNHFLGTSYFAPLKLVNLTKPGRYSVFVEYKCPFSITDVPVTPFWGSESGAIKSNLVMVEVLR